jgi:hypothetical protein
VDNLNVMPIVFGLLALLFAAGVARSLLQIVRHPGPESAPPLPARPRPAVRSRSPSHPLAVLLGGAFYGLGLLLLNRLVARHPRHAR